MQEKENQKITRIEDIRCSQFGKKVTIKGIITKIHKVRPKVIAVTWECKDCGEEIETKQEGFTLEMPTVCVCGNQKKFKMLKRKITDSQKMIISDSKDISVYFEGTLVNKSSKMNLGTPIILTGIVKIILEKKQRISNFVIECSSIIQTIFYNKFNKTEIMQILRMMKEMQNKSPEGFVNRENLISYMEEEGMGSAKADEIIECLRKSGELFEPKPGFIRMV